MKRRRDEGAPMRDGFANLMWFWADPYRSSIGER